MKKQNGKGKVKRNNTRNGNGKRSGKEIAEKKKTSLAVSAEVSGRGFEAGIDNDDLIIPRAKLTQQMSPEVVEDDMKSGLIINSLTKEVLPEIFIPIFVFKNYIRFNPRDNADVNFNADFEPGGIIWRSNDPLDPKVMEETKFSENGDKPIAMTFLNFLSYFKGIPMPIIVSFSKTSYKVGKQLLSLSKFSGGDMFSRRYQIESKKTTTGGNTYFVLKVSPAGKVDDKEESVLCEKWWTDYSPKAGDIQVHEEDKQDGVEESSRPY